MHFIQECSNHASAFSWRLILLEIAGNEISEVGRAAFPSDGLARFQKIPARRSRCHAWPSSTRVVDERLWQRIRHHDILIDVCLQRDSPG